MAKRSGCWSGARAAMAFQRENGVLFLPVPTHCPQSARRALGTPGDGTAGGSEAALEPGNHPGEDRVL